MLAVSVLCSRPGKAQAADAAPPVVIVSIAPQKYMVERIAGKSVQVVVLVKAGADPHSYEPTAAQMRLCAAARIWFTMGLPFEDAWLARIRDASPALVPVSTIAHITRLSSGDDDADGHKHPHDDRNGEDPHVWLSPMLVRGMLPGMAEELGKLLPQTAAQLQANAALFSGELEQLHKTLTERFNSLAHDKRIFLTVHPSWRYFARDYALTELDIEVQGKEPGPQSMKAISNTAKAHGIRSIFTEPQFPRAAAQAIADGIGAKLVEVDPLAENLPGIYTRMADKLMESFPR